MPHQMSLQLLIFESLLNWTPSPVWPVGQVLWYPHCIWTQLRMLIFKGVAHETNLPWNHEIFVWCLLAFNGSCLVVTNNLTKADEMDSEDEVTPTQCISLKTTEFLYVSTWHKLMWGVLILQLGLWFRSRPMVLWGPCTLVVFDHSGTLIAGASPARDMKTLGTQNEHGVGIQCRRRVLVGRREV